MGLIERFLRLPGSAERYLDFLSEREISRRQHDNLINGASPEDRATWAEATERSRLGRLLEDYARAQDLDRVQGAHAGFFDFYVNELKNEDNSASGSKAEALIQLGRRQLDWDFPVGETPT